MAFTVPLPKSMHEHLNRNTHPGLLLDKYAESWDEASTSGKLSEKVQKPTVEAVVRLSQCPPSGLKFDVLAQRWQRVLGSFPGIQLFRCATTGPLTLHLARASALENAGICLDPIYGFAYLPGTGLKGMAHAYACEEWLPAHERHERQAAWRQICHVFGWAPSPWLSRLAMSLSSRFEFEAEIPSGAHVGSIVFHDAWPETWPRLIEDIVNNHHPAYYQDSPDSDDHPPGDWENPVPIYFLAVEPSTVFVFGVSERRKQDSYESDGLLQMAREWLLGALCHCGAGAKTGAGYGYFRPADQKEPSPPGLRRIWTGALDSKEARTHEIAVQLRLVSPAFLGGPDRDAQPIARLATLKAMLRTWWRAWHGHLTTQQLRTREAQVFGSIDHGTGLRLLPAETPTRLNVLRKGQRMGQGGSGLGYLAYGPIGYEKRPGEQTGSNRTQVDAVDANQHLHFRLAHRSQSDLRAALKSLWLLGALGGLGSRCRRGWGSLRLETLVPDLPKLAECRTIDEYRENLLKGLATLAQVSGRKQASDLCWTALSEETRIVLSQATFRAWQEALEDLGKRFQQYRQRDGRGIRDALGPDYHKTKALLTGRGEGVKTLPERSGFGLPYAQAYRSLKRNPRNRREKAPTATFSPEWSEDGGTVEGRRASPLVCKVVRLAGGQFIWQVAFLPAQFLPQGGRVRAERTDVKPAEALSSTPFDPPGPLGVPRSGGSVECTLITDFLDQLEGKSITGSSLPVSPPASLGSSAGLGKPRAVPPRKKLPRLVNKGQEREGTLRPRDEGWAAIFAGDDREAVISNPASLPPDIRDGDSAIFYIVEESKKTGIRARFQRML